MAGPHIAIDFSSFDTLNLAHGLFRYGVDLVYGLNVIRPQAEFHLLGSRPVPPAELSAVFDEPGSRWRYHQLIRRPPHRGAYFLDQVPAATLISRILPNLLHSLDYFAPLLAPCRLLMTVYDIMPEVLTPRREYRRPLYLNCLRAVARFRISRFLTISKTTALDLQRRWGLPQNQLSVVPLGIRLPPSPITTSKSAAASPVLLARYSLARQKNFPTFLHAIARVHKRFPDLRVLLFGNSGHGPEDDTAAFRLTHALGLGSVIEHRGFVSDSELDGLYREATVYVLPSLYEGFGLPLVEAMARGVCVVAHRAGAMAEVVGTAGVLVDAQAPDSLADGIINLLAQADQRNQLAALGIKKAVDFSVELMAERTFAVYRSCLA